MNPIIIKSPSLDMKDTEYLKSITGADEDKNTIVIVAGGDNTMLTAIKKHYKKGLPFFGINFGHVGFLLNNIRPQSKEALDKSIKEAKRINLWMLKGIIEYEDSSFDEVIGFNEIWMASSGGQTLNIKMEVNRRNISGMVVGDGMIVSTPQGSTGYNRAAGGRIIKPSIPVIQATPLSCTIGDRRQVMSSFIEKDNAEIKLNLLNRDFRQADVYSDGILVSARDKIIKSVSFVKSELVVEILFHSEQGFYDKIYNLEHFE